MPRERGALYHPAQVLCTPGGESWRQGRPAGLGSARSSTTESPQAGPVLFGGVSAELPSKERLD